MACCRHVWDLLLDERSQKAVAAAELYADGLLSLENLSSIRTAARAARKAVKGAAPLAGFSPVFNAAHAADAVVEDSGDNAVAALSWVSSSIGNQAVPDPADGDFDDAYEAVAYFNTYNACPLLRDIFGNPFRLARTNAAWLTPTVVRLSQSIYDDRAFDRMPKLADALEEAGCTDADILAHCRQAGPHVRGCWVIDLLLGKE